VSMDSQARNWPPSLRDPDSVPLTFASGTPRCGSVFRTEDLAHRRNRSSIDPITPTVEIFPPDSVTRNSRTWDGIVAESVTMREHRRTESRFRSRVHLLAVFEECARRDGSTFVEGLPPSSLRNYRRKLLFVPAGHEYDDWQEPRTLARMAFFYFDPVALRRKLDIDIDATPLAPRLFFEHAGLWDLAMKLKALIDRPEMNDRLYGAALGLVLLHDFVRFNAGSPRGEAPVRGGLAAWQQRAIASYIEEHLSEPISLTTLAQMVRLSPYHFCRAFKQSFGMPPHRFHTHRRIERAKELLVQTRASVTDIGIEIGFSETSSFTAAFRKVTGLTPTGYQRSFI